MAFPSVAASAVTNGSTAADPVTVNLPSGIVAGSLLIMLIRNAGANLTTGPSGWTQLASSGADASDDTTSIFWKKADGSEGSTITVDYASSQKFAAITLRITGHADPATQPPEISATANTGTATTPNPPDLTPTGGAKDYLWLWMGGWEGEQTSPPTGDPANYTGRLGADSGTAGAVTTNCRVAVSTRQLNAASENPPAWTISASDDFTTWAVVVHPAGASLFTDTMDGAITPAGVLTKQVIKAMTGASTPSGVMAKSLLKMKTLSGASTPSGVLVKQDAKTLAGSITPGAVMSRQVSYRKTLAGSITPAGVMSRSTAKTLSGTITPAGVMTKLKAIFKTLSGSLTPAGVMTKYTSKTLAGSSTPSGILIKRISKTFYGPRIFRESFDTADGSAVGPDLSWTEVLNDWSIASNELVMGASTGAAAIRADVALQNDQWAEVVVGAATVITTRLGPAVRINGAGDTYYEFDQRLDGLDDTRIRKSVGGAFTDLIVADSTAAIVQGDVLRLEVVGNRLTAYLNGTAILTATDSAIASGSPGIYGSQSGANRLKIASFRAGSLFAPTGVMTKAFPKTLTGSLTPSGAMSRITTFRKALAGALTPSGVLNKRIPKTMAGAITPSGVMTKTKLSLKTLSGSLTPSGALLKRTGKTMVGAITPSGAMARYVSKVFVGSLTPAGVMTKLKAIFKTLSGSITPSGVLTKRTSKTLAGTQASAGALTKRIAKTLTGASIPSGVMAKSKLTLKSFAGAITPSGTLAKRISKTLAGDVTPTGSLTKRLSKTLSGALPPVGVLTRSVARSLAGSLTPAGNLVRSALKEFVREISPSAGLTKQVSKVPFAAQVSPIGQMVKTLSKTITSSLTPSGVLTTSFITLGDGVRKVFEFVARTRVYQFVKVVMTATKPNTTEQAVSETHSFTDEGDDHPYVG